MPTKRKSFWGSVSIECHFIKALSLVAIMCLVGGLVFVKYALIPTLDVMMQGRTYGEIVDGVSNSFFNEPTILVDDQDNGAPVGDPR